MSWVMAMTVRPAAPIASTTAPTRATPSASWPVVGSSRTRIGGSIARTPASATSLRRDRSRSYGLVDAVRGEADRVSAARRRGRRRRGRNAEVARPERHLALDRPLEQLVVGVLEHEPDGRGELGDRPARRSTSPAEQDRALGRAEQAVEVLHERRLARAVLAEDRDRLARLDRQRDAADAPRCRRGSGGRGPRSRCARRGRSAIGVQRGTASRARGGADDGRRGLGAGRAGAPAATAASSNAAAGDPERPPRRRTSVGGADPTGWPPGPAPTPGTSRATARPASSTRHRSIRPRTADRVRRTGSSCRSRASSRAGRRRRRSPPGRAAPSARRGPGRAVPIATMLAIATRCCSPPDSANGSRSARWRDAQALEHGIDPRVHLVARDAEVLEAERELLADRLLRGRQLVGRRREHDPDLAEQRPLGWGRRRSMPSIATSTVDLGPDDARDEPGAASARVDLPAPVRPGDADALAAADRSGRSPRGCARDVPDTGRRGPDRRAGSRRPCVGAASASAPSHGRTTPDATSDDDATAPARTSSRSQRSIGGSATTR